MLKNNNCKKENLLIAQTFLCCIQISQQTKDLLDIWFKTTENYEDNKKKVNGSTTCN